MIPFPTNSSIAITGSVSKPRSQEVTQLIFVICAMAVAIALSPFAPALRGMYAGVTAAFVLAFAFAVIASQSSRSFVVYASVPIVFCCITLAWCIISPLPGAEVEGLPITDRLNYYYLYYAPDIFSYSQSYEIGFLFLMSIIRPWLAFASFLILCATIVLIGYGRILSALERASYFPLVLCISLGYFAFWNGALNVSRQFLAAGLIFIGASLLLTSAKPKTNAHVICAALGAVATLMHSSAMILFVFQALIYVRHRSQVLRAMWLFNAIIFALNFVGFSPLRLITSRVSSFQRYDVEQLSWVDLANLLSTGVGTGNRLDWALFLALPMLPYLTLRGMRHRSNMEQDGISALALFYTTMTVPFYSFSFLVYADRLAYYAFLILPIFVILLAAAPAMKPYRVVMIGGLGLITISQFAIGWYGYTPLFWSEGLSAGI